MGTYQRILTHDFIPFDPLELAKITEKKITRKGPEGLERKYTGIYSAPVYGGIATGYFHLLDGYLNTQPIIPLSDSRASLS